MGLASDAIAPRGLMTGGAILGAIATQLFGMSSRPGIFFLSRTVEGLSAAAVTPSLLSHLTDVTDGNHSLRARVMSYFELSLLRSEEHTSELQSHLNLVCRLLLEKKKHIYAYN